MSNPSTPRRLLGSLALVALTLMACSPISPDPASRLPGTWRAVLQVPGGELPFGLEFVERENRLEALLINGPDRVAVTEVTLEGNTLRLRMPGFENVLDASLDGDSLVGTLTMIKKGGAEQRIPFTARRGDSWRFSPDEMQPAATSDAAVSGRWAVTFGEDEKASPAVGEFTQQGRRVTGTFLTPTGDHRFLAGEVRGRELKLSKFDGGHVFLYRATLDDDGRLRGRFWSGTASVEDFVAQRDDDASLGDAENRTTLAGKADRLDFRFPDVGGSSISITDPFFRGKVVIVALAGSWCPNCHDEAAFLADLHRRKRSQGFEIISLMFEQFGDFAKAAEATYRFRDRHRIEYTTLIAGTSDKDDAAAKLPQLSGVYAFPTTIFLDRQGKVRKIHTGFSGPATGVHYERLIGEFEKTVDALLAEPRA